MLESCCLGLPRVTNDLTKRRASSATTSSPRPASMTRQGHGASTSSAPVRSCRVLEVVDEGLQVGHRRADAAVATGLADQTIQPARVLSCRSPQHRVAGIAHEVDLDQANGVTAERKVGQERCDLLVGVAPGEQRREIRKQHVLHEDGCIAAARRRRRTRRLRRGAARSSGSHHRRTWRTPRRTLDDGRCPPQGRARRGGPCRAQPRVPGRVWTCRAPGPRPSPSRRSSPTSSHHQCRGNGGALLDTAPTTTARHGCGKSDRAKWFTGSMSDTAWSSSETPLELDGEHGDVGPLGVLDELAANARVAFLVEMDHCIHERHEFRLLCLRYLAAHGWRWFGEELDWRQGERTDAYLQAGDEALLEPVDDGNWYTSGILAGTTADPALARRDAPRAPAVRPGPASDAPRRALLRVRCRRWRRRLPPSRQPSRIARGAGRSHVPPRTAHARSHRGRARRQPRREDRPDGRQHPSHEGRPARGRSGDDDCRRRPHRVDRTPRDRRRRRLRAVDLAAARRRADREPLARRIRRPDRGPTGHGQRRPRRPLAAALRGDRQPERRSNSEWHRCTTSS